MGIINKRPVKESPVGTSFDDIHSRFLGTITDDMYLELTKEDTEEMLDEILIQALPWFKFPKTQNLLKYDQEKRCFYAELDEIETAIVVKYMTMVWLQQQIYTVDNIRQKYSGSDFKFTSQASHIKQLIALKAETEREGYHLQSDYSRRMKDKNGMYKTSLSKIMEVY